MTTQDIDTQDIEATEAAEVQADTAPPATETSESPQAPKELREFAERQKAAADKATNAAKRNGLLAAGLNPDKGVGKLIASAFDGDWLSETLVDDLRAWATDNEIELGASPRSDTEVAASAAESRGENLAAQARPVDTNPPDALAESFRLEDEGTAMLNDPLKARDAAAILLGSIDKGISHARKEGLI